MPTGLNSSNKLIAAFEKFRNGSVKQPVFVAMLLRIMAIMMQVARHMPR